MVFDGVRATLRLDEHKALPQPGAHEVQIRVHACGVCRTDLHVVDRDLTQPKLPLIP
ncbi:MAG: alcohol dehydrogenase catalytic domain-containing protein, partial [Rhodopila sp.]